MFATLLVCFPYYLASAADRVFLHPNVPDSDTSLFWGSEGQQLNFRITYGGTSEMQEEAMSFLIRAVIAAFLLILLILITQFKSFLRPIIIATTVLMSFVGVLLGLVITQDKIGLMMTGAKNIVNKEGKTDGIAKDSAFENKKEEQNG